MNEHYSHFLPIPVFFMFRVFHQQYSAIVNLHGQGKLNDAVWFARMWSLTAVKLILNFFVENLKVTFFPFSEKPPNFLVHSEFISCYRIDIWIFRLDWDGWRNEWMWSAASQANSSTINTLCMQLYSQYWFIAFDIRVIGTFAGLFPTTSINILQCTSMSVVCVCFISPFRFVDR